MGTGSDNQPRASADEMGESSRGGADAHTRDRLRWLDQVMADRDLTPFAFSVAYVVASHVSRETGDAWPSQARIAEVVRSTERGVRKAIDQLVDFGHLHTTAPNGRKGGNRYRLVLLAPTSFDRNGGSDEDKFHRNGGSVDEANNRNGGSYESGVHRNGGSGSEPFHRNGGSCLTGTVVPPIPLNETSEKETLPQTASPKRETRKPKPKADDDAGFDELWKLYPRKVGKDAARKAYTAAVGRGGLPGDIMAGVRRYAAERAGEDERYTAHASTWLNAGRWTDSPQSGKSGVTASGIEPTVYIPGMGDVPEASVWATMGRWQKARIWLSAYGPPPDDPDFRLPQRFLEPQGAT